jgi:hypothetical protein
LSVLTVCDGCGKTWPFVELTQRGPVIEGRRANGLCGGRPLPDGDFHWCEDCGKAAFAAVAARRTKGNT